MFLKLVNRTDMKKIICFLLVIIVANTILYAQIEGVIKWEENKDFTYQEIDKYVNITSASGYVETIGAPQLPYCIKTFLVPINSQVSLQVKKVKKQLLKEGILFIAVRLNSTTIKIVCSTADFPRSSIFFSFPSPPNQKVMDLEVTPRRISTPFPSPFQDY